MLTPLSERQAEILRFIIAYQKRESRAPTLWEISVAVNAAGHYSLNALERKGYIARHKNQPRGIVVLRDPDNPTVCPACERPFTESTA
jgi:SOS-response transcriptional repressor LexA